MKYNKKGIIILSSISIIGAILGIMLTIFMINYKKNINKTDTYIFSEFTEEEKSDDKVEETEDENNSENEIEEENKKEEQPQNDTTKTNTTTTNNGDYYIKVNIEANVVTIYTKDSSGNYTIPVKAMVCSTGTATPTTRSIYNNK